MSPTIQSLSPGGVYLDACGAAVYFAASVALLPLRDSAVAFEVRIDLDSTGFSVEINPTAGWLPQDIASPLWASEL